MKKFIILLTAFFLISEISNSQPYYNQWFPVGNPVTSNLNNSYKINIDYFVTGDNGVLLKSSGTGFNYTILPSGTNNNLYALTGVSTLFAAGQNGLILKSTNVGLNWITVSFPATQNIYSISNFVNLNYYILSGQGGMLYYSSNTGQNWVQVNSGTTSDLRSMFYSSLLSLYKGFLCGDNGTFLKMNIILPPLPPNIICYQVQTGYPNTFNSIVALNDTNNLLMAGSGGIILKSTNSGFNWIQINSGTVNNLKNITKVTSNELYIAGENGTVLKTTNGGYNWISQTVQNGGTINSILYLNSSLLSGYGNSGTIYKCNTPPSLSDTSNKIETLNGNYTGSKFFTDGTFNRNLTTTAGFEWPLNSGKYLVFTSGFSIIAKCNNEIRQAASFYTGHFYPGYINNGITITTPEINKVYKVTKSSNCYNSVDWANWGAIVPFGAPYIDVNNNSIFEPCIDTPGVKNAVQTLFMTITDGYSWKHVPIGFGGTTAPLMADLGITIYCYDDTLLSDMQFIKYKVTNKSNYSWDSVYFSFIIDPDLGEAVDDYIGCDSVRNLSYSYNSDNEDPIYGINPPAYGIRLIKYPVNKSVMPFDTVKMSSFIPYESYGTTVLCEQSAQTSIQAFYYARGFKNDLSPFMNPTYNPPVPVKFNYGGEPDGNTGWTERKGRVQNCGGTIGNIIDSNAPGDRRFLMNIGKDNFSIPAGGEATFVLAQMVARGTSNTNSVTKLKLLSDYAFNYYNTVGIKVISSEVPEDFILEQNYPNPFNSVSNIKFQIPLCHSCEGRGYPLGHQRVIIKVFDLLGREVRTLVNEELNPGTYSIRFDASGLSSGVYFYRMKAGDFVDTKKMVLVR